MNHVVIKWASLVLMLLVLTLSGCGEESSSSTDGPSPAPPTEAPVPTQTTAAPAEEPEPTPTSAPAEDKPSSDQSPQSPLLDDFESGDLPAGQAGYVSIGYFTWSDGSAVSIQAIEVSEGDALARPEQAGDNTILQLNTDVKSGGWAGFTHAFADQGLSTWTPQDWSSYQGIAMWVYGNDSGGTLFVDVQDNRNPDSSGDDAERWSFDLLDDFEGWQYVEMPFTEFRRKDIGNGAPNDGFNLTQVHGYALGAYGSVEMGQQTHYLDQVMLYGVAEERPVEITFAKTSYAVTEGGLATIRLKLSQPAEEAVSVQFFTLEGNADVDQDFTLPGDTVTFEAGNTEAAFKINAVDDAIGEGKEQTLVVLANPTGAVLGIQSRAILSIRDNESVDGAILHDMSEYPPFVSSEGVTLSTVEVAADSELALPGQGEFENVLQIAYAADQAPPTVSCSFGEAQDWSANTGLSFWFYGNNSGETITVALLDNQALTTADLPADEWELIWSEEFDQEAGTPPDPGIWQAEVGDGLLNGIPGWGNGEFETYTASPENAATDGEGNLVITARELDPELSDLRCWYGDCAYSSARLITWGRAEFAFGRVEARLKLPYGQGIWPAFWMLGTDLDEVGWPQSGEIDIMENVGREPTTVHGTIHGPGYSGGEGIGAGHDLADPVSNDFHVYAIEWELDQIRWFVDGVNHFTVTANDIPGGTEWVYNHPFFIILNLAVGGNWPGAPDDTTQFPQTLLVDYVRVYGAPSSSERYEYTFTDDLAGWQQISIPFSALVRSAEQPAGAPDDGLTLTEIWGYQFELPAGGRGTLYWDKIKLETVE